MTISETTRNRLLEAIHRSDEICGLTHNFYKYPARFSPYFVRAAIASFTKPGELVYDPFMGGATTLVEAATLGRRSVGTDINSLAVFVAKAKTSIMSNVELATVETWARLVGPELTVRGYTPRDDEWRKLGYYRNVSSRETWRIRKLIALALESCDLLESCAQIRLARAIILSTSQWALDSRRRVPSVREFRESFLRNALSTIEGAREYAHCIKNRPLSNRCLLPICLHRSAVGIETEEQVRKLGAPRLVLTSPPYPGVHVLYHRWQVKGRRESPAPYWIAGSPDGAGASYYTFGDRHDAELKKYFLNAEAAFGSLARICDKNTLIVQMVAFAKPDWQLPAYLAMLERAGFQEIDAGLMDDIGSRIWRRVPNRKWYASWRKSIPSSSEVVLFHRLRR
jgi:hypothetical protein